MQGFKINHPKILLAQTLIYWYYQSNMKTTEDLEDAAYVLEQEISDLKNENSKLNKIFEVERRKLNIVYDFPNWKVKDKNGVLAVDSSLLGVLAKI